MIDYCNAVLHGAPSYIIKKLQRVLNNAARIVLQAPRRSHSAAARSAEDRVQKVALPMFKVLYDTWPLE